MILYVKRLAQKGETVQSDDITINFETWVYQNLEDALSEYHEYCKAFSNDPMVESSDMMSFEQFCNQGTPYQKGIKHD